MTLQWQFANTELTVYDYQKLQLPQEKLMVSFGFSDLSWNKKELLISSELPNMVAYKGDLIIIVMSTP